MSTNRKLFISLPMNGRKDEDIWGDMLLYKKTVETLLQDKVILLDSFRKDRIMNRVEMLGDSINIMGQADLIFFAPGWYKSKGCRIERDVAQQYMPEKIFDIMVWEKTVTTISGKDKKED